jgi:DNA-binding IclR family transcriptional regulator
VFVRTTPGSQSLERGLSILRTFRHGVDSLTNADIAERTGLVRPTVSRLCRSLVDSGFLEFDRQQNAYRLSVASLSLALSFRSTEPELDVALPLMRELAQSRKVNVSLATADQLEMVYVETVRFSRQGVFRHQAAGSRIPIAITSLGRAYVAGLPALQRQSLLEKLQAAHGKDWPKSQEPLQQALQQFELRGFCYAQWQPGMGSVASPIQSPSGRTYALHISFHIESPDSETRQMDAYAALLSQLVHDVKAAWAEKIGD